MILTGPFQLEIFYDFTSSPGMYNLITVSYSLSGHTHHFMPPVHFQKSKSLIKEDLNDSLHDFKQLHRNSNTVAFFPSSNVFLNKVV